MLRTINTTTALQALEHMERGGEPVGTKVLGEMVRQPVLGPHVWSVYRLMVLWALSERRGEVLKADAVERLISGIAEVRELPTENPAPGLITLLCETLLPGPPNTLSMAKAALLVCDWALGNDHVETALAYVQLAAALSGKARFAWLAGRMIRERGRIREAAVWFRISYTVATRENDYDVMSRSLMSAGRVDLEAGNYQDALHQFLRAVNLATRFRLHARLGEAHHDAFSAYAAMGDEANAATEAAATLSAYGPGHPRLPAFAHDLALYWISSADYVDALELLLALLSRSFKDDLSTRVLVVATAMRGAGGAARPGTFDLLLKEFLSLREAAPFSVRIPQSLLFAARGAASLRRWGLAKSFADEAVRMAGAQNDIAMQAEELQRTVEREQTVDRKVAPVARHPSTVRTAVSLLSFRL